MQLNEEGKVVRPRLSEKRYSECATHQPLRCGASGAGKIFSPRVWCACRLYKRQDDLKAVAAQLKEALRKQEAERPPEPEYDSDGNEVLPPEPEPDAAPAVEAEGP